MGFFYKAGAAEGTSVHEESSYTALAAAAKTQANAQVMKNTSTGQFFVNYKPSGSPGIPVPAELYGDVTGYAVNATGSAYVIPSDDEGTDSDLTNRGFTISTAGTSTITKTASNPLIVNAPANSNGEARLQFITSSRHSRYLMIIGINSITKGPTSSAIGFGTITQLIVHNAAESKRFNFYSNFSYTGKTDAINYLVRWGTTAQFESGYGPYNTFSSGWIFKVYDTNDDQQSYARLENTKVPQVFDFGDVQNQTGQGVLSGDYLRLASTPPSSGSHTELDYQINEVHWLKI